MGGECKKCRRFDAQIAVYLELGEPFPGECQITEGTCFPKKCNLCTELVEKSKLPDLLMKKKLKGKESQIPSRSVLYEPQAKLNFATKSFSFSLSPVSSTVYTVQVLKKNHSRHALVLFPLRNAEMQGASS